MNLSQTEQRNNRWFRLSLSEQMSNISGEIGRYISNRDDYLSGRVDTDYSDFYYKKAIELIDRTELDPKNKRRIPELEDEKEQLRLLRVGKVTDEYITRYWNSYTKAIS